MAKTLAARPRSIERQCPNPKTDDRIGGMDEKSVMRLRKRTTVMIGYADQIGTLREGSAADVTVFEIEDGTFEFPEYGRGKVTCGKRFAPRLTILKGEAIFDVHCGRQDTCTGIGVSSSR